MTDTEPESEGFDFECDLDVLGRAIEEGSPVARCGFVSRGWPTYEARNARAEQHYHEHETGEPMPELVDAGIEVPS